jgi:predicted transcriptional regulator
MQSDAFTLYKLIILFILYKVDFSLNNAQISNIILEKGYTNYFSIQQSLSELGDADLISVKKIRNSSYFKLTNAGKETLEFFISDISEDIKSDIMDYLKTNKYDLREEGSTLADYYKSKQNEYYAHCVVMENDSNIIELSLNVPTEEEAAAICNNWREKSQEVYAFLMKTLM